jgi:hypothetical protein
MVSIVNTVINSLTGISNVTKITGLEVSDNPYLDRISLDVEEIGMIMVGPNDVSSGGQTSSFLNLEKAGTIIIRNSSDVQFPKLANVTRHFELLGNTFQNFSAPELKVCGGLVINDNTRLVDLDFPKLTTIRSGNSTLTVANNTRLDEISAFKNLETVAGGVTFSGNFSKLPLDSISQISGALTVDTASSTFNCKPITELKEDGVVKGKDRCRMNDKTKIGGTGTGTTTSSDGSASSSESIASPMEIPASFMPVFTVLAGLLSFFM